MANEPNELDVTSDQATAVAEHDPPAAADAAPAPPADTASAESTELRRILRISVPVIVRLATRSMPVRAIRQIAPGAIIEFDKCVDEKLDLLVNNRAIGSGTCVKVGEHFGIRLNRIDDATQRIKSLGR
jgi:flagellar motor switch protein FliN/FliY